MSDVYIIEVDGRAVGLVTRDQHVSSYRFHAALSATFALDGRSFSTPDEAQLAARRALTEQMPDTRTAFDRAA